MVKLISIPSFSILIVSLAVGVRIYREPPNKWHEGEKWEKFLGVYDDIAKEQYQECTSRLLPTKFGDTQVFACGSQEDPPLVLLHGISTCSLMFGDWLIPKLSQTHYTVAIDTMCDMGRSRPTDGDASNCPKTEQDTAEWVEELFAQLNIKKASLIGFSFGSFLASCVAINVPELVDKMVLIAPAGVFAPIELAWLFRAIFVGMIGSVVGSESVYTESVRNWFVGYMTTVDPSTAFQYPELMAAAESAGSAQVGVRPVAYSVETLRDMNERSPTLLIIGENETVTSADVAIETATQAGIKVKAYPNAGHILFAEYPKEEIIDVIASFLDSSK